MKKLFAVLMLIALPLAAADVSLLQRYEAVRQALLKSSVGDMNSAAKQLAVDARSAKNESLAKRADAVVAAKKIDAAKAAFAALSEEMIRNFGTGKEGFVVGYCPMEKKSWLQPKGEVSNPYVEDGMRTCGSVR